MKRLDIASGLALLGMAFAPCASAQSRSLEATDHWSWRFGINLWLPGIEATTRFDAPGGGTIGGRTDPSGYLEKLDFVFMGTVEARRGPWSVMGDVVQLSF